MTRSNKKRHLKGKAFFTKPAKTGDVPAVRDGDQETEIQKLTEVAEDTTTVEDIVPVTDLPATDSVQAEEAGAMPVACNPLIIKDALLKKTEARLHPRDIMRAIGEAVFMTADLHNIVRENCKCMRLLGASAREIDCKNIPLRHEKELTEYFTSRPYLDYTDPGLVAKISFTMHADTHRCDNKNDIKRGTQIRANDCPIDGQPSEKVFKEIQKSTKIISDHKKDSHFPRTREVRAIDLIRRGIHNYTSGNSEVPAIPTGYDTLIKQQVFEAVGVEMMERIADNVLYRRQMQQAAKQEQFEDDVAREEDRLSCTPIEWSGFSAYSDEKTALIVPITAKSGIAKLNIS